MSNRQSPYRIGLEDNFSATVGPEPRESVETRSGELSAGRTLHRNHYVTVEMPRVRSRIIESSLPAQLTEYPDNTNYALIPGRTILSGDTETIYEPRWKQTVREFAKLLRKENLPGLERIMGRLSGTDLIVWAVFDRLSLEDRLRAYHVRTSYVRQEENPHIFFHVLQRRGDPLEHILDVDENMIELSSAEI